VPVRPVERITSTYISGFLAAPFGIEGNAWVNLGEDHNTGWPNVQVYASSVAPNYDAGALSATFSGLRKSVRGRSDHAAGCCEWHGAVMPRGAVSGTIKRPCP
jgi:hypothetical protein